MVGCGGVCVSLSGCVRVSSGWMRGVRAEIEILKGSAL